MITFCMKLKRKTFHPGCSKFDEYAISSLLLNFMKYYQSPTNYLVGGTSRSRWRVADRTWSRYLTTSPPSLNPPFAWSAVIILCVERLRSRINWTSCFKYEQFEVFITLFFNCGVTLVDIWLFVGRAWNIAFRVFAYHILLHISMANWGWKILTKTLQC